MATHLEIWLRFLPLFGGLVAFAWGIYEYTDTQAYQAEIRKIEARKPFLQRQLELYTEATQVASRIYEYQDLDTRMKDVVYSSALSMPGVIRMSGYMEDDPLVVVLGCTCALLIVVFFVAMLEIDWL